MKSAKSGISVFDHTRKHSVQSLLPQILQMHIRDILSADARLGLADALYCNGGNLSPAGNNLSPAAKCPIEHACSMRS